MNLTNEQVRAIKEGLAVQIVPPEVGEQCVVLRADLYRNADRSAHDIDPRMAYPAVDDAWKEGWDQPSMADYDHYEDFVR